MNRRMDGRRAMTMVILILSFWLAIKMELHSLCIVYLLVIVVLLEIISYQKIFIFYYIRRKKLTHKEFVSLQEKKKQLYYVSATILYLPK